jgi:hypothetical protein
VDQDQAALVTMCVAFTTNPEITKREILSNTKYDAKNVGVERNVATREYHLTEKAVTCSGCCMT